MLLSTRDEYANKFNTYKVADTVQLPTYQPNFTASVASRKSKSSIILRSFINVKNGKT